MTSNITSRRHGVNGSLAVKVPCKSATTADITLSGEQTIDGIALVSGDRCLVKSQTTGSENGVYAVNTSTWQREPDWDGNRDVAKGTHVYVTDGSTTFGGWRVTASNPIVVGTTDITFDFSELDTTLRSQLADTSTDDGTKGFHLVHYPPLSGETGVVNYEYPYNNVLRFITLSLHDSIRDGTNTATLTSFVQNAIDSLSSDGGEVIFPPGSYYYATAIVSTKPNVKITAEGVGGYIANGPVKFHTDQAIIMFDIGSASVTEHRGWKFDGVHFLDTAAGATGAIRFRRTNNVRVSDCFFEDFTIGYAVYADGTGDACIVYLFDNMKSRNCKFGFQHTGAIAAHVWIGGFLNGNNIASNIGIEAGDTTYIYGTALDNWAQGITVTAGGAYLNPRLESNTTHIHILSTAQRVTVDSVLMSNGTNGVILEAGSKSCVITNNKYPSITTPITNNTTAGDAVFIHEPDAHIFIYESSSPGLDIEHKISNIRQSLNEDARFIAAAGRNATIAVLEALFESTPMVRVGSTTNTDLQLIVNGVASAQLDDSVTAGNTRMFVYDVDNGQLERVTVGAADSGGAGYKVLRILN